eukprot:8795713-Ditylum_brightwellii.AAC.1
MVLDILANCNKVVDYHVCVAEEGCFHHSEGLELSACINPILWCQGFEGAHDILHVAETG